MTRQLLRPGKLVLYPSQRQAEGALTAAFLGKGMLKEAMEVVIRKRTKNGYLEIAQVLQRGTTREDIGGDAHCGRAVRGALSKRIFSERDRTVYEMAGPPTSCSNFKEWAVELPDPNRPEAVRHSARSFPEIEGNSRFQASYAGWDFQGRA